MTNTKLFLLVGTALSLISNSAFAESCTATPDCKTLGYTQTSCPDGSGVKCPWNTSLWYCNSGNKNACKGCYLGWILNSDMTCSQNKISGKTPIGVIFNQTIINDGKDEKCTNTAIALEYLKSGHWNTANTWCKNYNISNISGWTLPLKEDLFSIYTNRKQLSSGIAKAGGTMVSDRQYWSSSFAYYDEEYGYDSYFVANPLKGIHIVERYANSTYPALCVLSF